VLRHCESRLELLSEVITLFNGGMKQSPNHLISTIRGLPRRFAMIRDGEAARNDDSLLWVVISNPVRGDIKTVDGNL